MKKKVRTRRHHVEPIGLVKTNPCAKDTDGDGIKDGKEVSGKKVRQTVRGQGRPLPPEAAVQRPVDRRHRR